MTEMPKVLANELALAFLALLICLNKGNAADSKIRISRAIDSPVRRAFSNWTPFSVCSLSCGGGLHSRTRACLPGPGLPCIGPLFEQSPCNPKRCPEWTVWGSWDSCGTSCGPSSKTRRRVCSGGAICPGSMDSQIQYCNLGLCPVGQWTPWGSWSTCSVTCGIQSGNHQRQRSCAGLGDCVGQSTGADTQTGLCYPQDRAPCGERNLETVEIAVWQPWGHWSECKTKCGIPGGIMRRDRKCSTNRAACLGVSFEARICPPNPPCPPPPSWETWGEWTSCDSTCGPSQGTRKRTRACPDRDEVACAGTATQVGPCLPGPPCPPPPGWTEWSEWSECSRTCGNAGDTVSQTRICQTGSPGIYPCAGLAELKRACPYKPPCPPGDPNYEWTQWGSWGLCDKLCGAGFQERARKCQEIGASRRALSLSLPVNGPFQLPNFLANGRSSIDSKCPGAPLERQSCQGLPCPVKLGDRSAIGVLPPDLVDKLIDFFEGLLDSLGDPGGFGQFILSTVKPLMSMLTSGDLLGSLGSFFSAGQGGLGGLFGGDGGLFPGLTRSFDSPRLPRQVRSAFRSMPADRQVSFVTDASQLGSVLKKLPVGYRNQVINDAARKAYVAHKSRK